MRQNTIIELAGFQNCPIVIQASNQNESIRNRLWLPISGNKGTVSFLTERLINAGFPQIILAVSDLPGDDVFEALVEQYGVIVVRGDFLDIPSRLLLAADQTGAEHFVRINATSPLVDLNKLCALYAIHREGNYDYSFNEHREGVLWGTGCDVFRTDFLRSLSAASLTPSQRETLGQYIRQNRTGYRVYSYVAPKPPPGYKVSLETQKDYELICELANNLDEISVESITAYLDAHPLVARYNQESPPRENGTEKLLFNREKAENILRRRIPDMLYPVSVELTLTNACNLRCSYCSDLALRQRQGARETVPFETLEQLFRDLAGGGTKGVVLEGGGEPTLYSRFPEAVRAAKEAGLAVGLITNGTRSMEPELLSQFEWIRVSLDASTREEYLALKGVDRFEGVIENIADYARYCPTVGVGYVVTRNNISEVEPLVIRLRELGVTYCQFRPVVDAPELYPVGIDLNYLRFYQTAGFGVSVDGMRENAEAGNNSLPCLAHSITSVISGDGSVYICGRLNIYDWLKPIGNINEKTFRKIWYGEERQRQAEQLSDAAFCAKNCPQCRISKFNQLFARLELVRSVHFI